MLLGISKLEHNFFFFHFLWNFYLLFLFSWTIKNMNVLLQSFQRKSKSFCFVKSLDIFEIVPPCCPRKVVGIGKVVWCRILVTGIFELISDFSNIKSKFKQKGNANLSRSNPLGHTSDCKFSVSGWLVLLCSLDSMPSLLYHTLFHITQASYTSGQWSHSGLASCLMDQEGLLSNREESLKGKGWKEK